MLSMIKIVLTIRALDIGGAEKQFIELVKHIDKKKFDVTVCSMYGGVQESILMSMFDIRYVNLQKNGRYDFYRFYKKYSILLKEIQPDVIYSFLGEMNLFSLWCKPKKTKLIWGFRASDKDWSQYGWVPRKVFYLQQKFSAKVDKIICNSIAAINYHKKYHFDLSRAVVVANGIDCQRFQRDTVARKNFRKLYNLPEDALAIGLVARQNKIKGYDIFSAAAKKILQQYKKVYFFAVGEEDISIKKECQVILGEEHKERFFWLGKQEKVEEIYSGLDIVVSSSFAEGFSNSIAEAMSASVPCVVTDVGDSAMIVDTCGIVVKPRDSLSLYQGIEAMIALDYVALGECSQSRVVQNFSIETMVQNTQKEIISCVE